ncbi:hypothetical protein BDV96DRAFT_484729 [Lophiotrema nucula]|uniref:Myosin class II heavy chain n=1 Tax=Lophiotrema nucula TaxID=690887 RepID=A0A6A5ZP66_9PLEO|nr:hypothetical protein BDV96DRAFT_484729 [Lophiotrema nucula]
MQARRLSSSSLPPPSSPPSVLQIGSEVNSPSEARGVPSPAQTLWTAAPSPTQTLVYSSPELPPLPGLSAFHGIQRTPSTAARNDRTDSTSYFTASWGSPYRHPPPSFNRGRQPSNPFGSDDLEGDSSNLEFGLEHLLPPRLEEDHSPNRFNLEHLIPSRLPQVLAETPTRSRSHPEATPRLIAFNLTGPSAVESSDPTEAWVRQFLEDRWNHEANNWRSDSSAKSDLGDKPEEEQEALFEKPYQKKGHASRRNNKTLNQQDFWSHFSRGEKEELGKMMASRYADPEAHSRQGSGASLKSPMGRSTFAEKSPVPSMEEPAPEAPKHDVETPSKVQAPVQPVPSPTPTPRIRKKVLVGRKACIIHIPHDIPRGTPGYPPRPMSPAAVESKMQHYKDEGYSTRGFEHWTGMSDFVATHSAQNRGIWPDEGEIRADRASVSRLRVRVPNSADWKAYVDSLLEAKLAALGVSLGGEEEVSPAPMSRQNSSQHPGLPFSPPLPTSSAGSHRVRQGSIVSGSFPLGPSPGHMSRQSMASPISFGNPRASMHLRGHSTFASPASLAQQAASPSGQWSPGNYFGPQGFRGGSPALPLSRPDLADLVSPGSPFGIRPGQSFPITPTQKDDLLVQMQQQQQQLQAQLLQQQQQQLLGLRPSSTLAEVPEDDGEEEDEIPALKHAGQPGPEIAVPTPRGHRHNISANLEREARDAEYHLEQAIDKQFDEGGDFSTEPEVHKELKPSNPVTNSRWEDSRPVLHQPQPHSRAHSLAKPQQPVSFGFPAQQQENPRADVSDGARTNISEVTNPSLEEEKQRDTANSSAQHSKTASQVSNTWKDSKFAFGKPGSAMHSKHTSRSSISKLNVEAKEFKFNPSASFSPNSLSSSFSFSPGLASSGGIPRSNNASIDGLSSLNVSAPTFKPDAPAFKPAADAPSFKPAVDAPVFNPSGMLGSTMPSGGFDFFSKGPSFKPDAPVFNPGSAEFKPSSTAPEPVSANFKSKIFGSVNISANDIIKPAKRSKAVPIVRPDATRQKTPDKEPEERDDESGRITRPEGREKRTKMLRADGDDVPKFATQPILSSSPLAEKRQPQSTKQDLQIEGDIVPEDKENLSPNAERAPSKSKSPEPLALRSESPAVEAGAPTPETEGTEENERSTEDLSDSRTPINDRTPHESDAFTPTVEEAPKPFVKKHGHKSSLSATAKPFEFRPQFGSSSFEPGIHVTKPSVAQSEDLDNTHVSPPRHASRSPATTFRPSDDGSYKTALESRRHAPYPESESVDFNQFDPSFNDIDAVMKHMNEEGSDFGVERDNQAWDQSSARLSTHDFDRHDLPPNANMRSDAPSPSPRRLYAPRNINASSTSITHDPFDDERAALAYESPVHRLNNADEVPMSDWDEGLSSEGEDKIQTRSRFFDNHVDDLIGRLLQSRLGPLERNLQGIQDAIALMSQRPGRGRRSLSTNERLDSDADDEDDEIGTDSHYRTRSPRKDRKLEKIRSIVREALESHQPAVTSLPVPVPEPMLPEKIREVVLEALAAQQPQQSNEAESDDIRAIVTEALASHAPKSVAPAVEPMQPDDIRAIVMEAFSTHAPQPLPASVPEQIRPEDIRSIITEAIAAQPKELPSAPATEPVQPDMIRSIVAEALASHKPALAPALEAPVDIPQPQIDMSELYQVVGSLKASIAQAAGGNLQAEDVRAVIDEALKMQGVEVAKREEAEALIEKDARITDLEAKLQEAADQLNGEIEVRRVLEAREADGARLLRVTEEELTLLREAAGDDENKIKALKQECAEVYQKLDVVSAGDDELRSKLVALQIENDDLKAQTIGFRTSQEDSKKRLDAVSAENEALTFTLEEHRLSATKWRDDVQQANEENEKMRKAIESYRLEAQEATRIREAMRAKFEKLQQDVIVASGQAAAERAQWQKSDESHMKKYEVLSARIEAEGRTRERLERELERLGTQEREGMRLRITLEQAQKHNARLEESIEQLRQESVQHQRTAERYEREYREAREAAHVEIRRTRTLLEADIDAANNQVNIVRAELDAEVARVRTELDNVRLDADTTKAKHELDLEAASDARKHAVTEVLESKRLALIEQQQAYERRLEALSKEHSRALEMAQEDKERADEFHNDRLSLANSKMEHLQDKVTLLEEKLSVAKEAASAAVVAAQSVKSPPPGAQNSSAYASGAEKISPQALRESIAVLQEQLQERESRIESLEHQLAEIDTDAPAKLKERDTEIGWLRELLGVRIDDLNDLINALAQPSFDRETVRDAAIRIRTNLQMEQSEKERLVAGGQSFPTLATLSNFASPKAVQLAAAFGNWRKGRDNATSTLAGTPSKGNSRDQTPSRLAPAPAQSFLSGLMTPPTSNLRRTPDLPSSGARPQNLRSNSASSRGSVTGFPSLGKQPQPVPSTPPLLRKASYDQDAEDGHFSESGFYDDESTVDGDVTPIGLNFGHELRR